MRDDAAAAVVDVALEGGQQGAGLYPAVPVVEATAAEAGVAARANAGAEVVYAFGGAYGQVVGDFELAPVDELAVEVEFQVVGADAAGHDLHLLPVGPGHALAATQQGGHAAFGRGQFRAREVQRPGGPGRQARSEEHTSELQSPDHLVCRLLLEKKKQQQTLKQSSALQEVIEGGKIRTQPDADEAARRRRNAQSR